MQQFVPIFSWTSQNLSWQRLVIWAWLLLLMIIVKSKTYEVLIIITENVDKIDEWPIPTIYTNTSTNMHTHVLEYSNLYESGMLTCVHSLSLINWFAINWISIVLLYICNCKNVIMALKNWWVVWQKKEACVLLCKNVNQEFHFIKSNNYSSCLYALGRVKHSASYSFHKNLNKTQNSITVEKLQ